MPKPTQSRSRATCTPFNTPGILRVKGQIGGDDPAFASSTSTSSQPVTLGRATAQITHSNEH
jgi:hypothetical protein